MEDAVTRFTSTEIDKGAVDIPVRTMRISFRLRHASTVSKVALDERLRMCAFEELLRLYCEVNDPEGSEALMAWAAQRQQQQQEQQAGGWPARNPSSLRGDPRASLPMGERDRIASYGGHGHGYGGSSHAHGDGDGDGWSGRPLQWPGRTSGIIDGEIHASGGRPHRMGWSPGGLGRGDSPSVALPPASAHRRTSAGEEGDHLSPAISSLSGGCLPTPYATPPRGHSVGTRYRSQSCWSPGDVGSRSPSLHGHTPFGSDTGLVAGIVRTGGAGAGDGGRGQGDSRYTIETDRALFMEDNVFRDGHQPWTSTSQMGNHIMAWTSTDERDLHLSYLEAEAALQEAREQVEQLEGQLRQERERAKVGAQRERELIAAIVRENRLEREALEREFRDQLYLQRGSRGHARDEKTVGKGSEQE